MTTEKVDSPNDSAGIGDAPVSHADGPIAGETALSPVEAAAPDIALLGDLDEARFEFSPVPDEPAAAQVAIEQDAIDQPAAPEQPTAIEAPSPLPDVTAAEPAAAQGAIERDVIDHSAAPEQPTAIEAPSPPLDVSAAEPALLTIRNVSRRYGSVCALEGIDLELRHGEVVAVLGDNGAGKTTLLNILAGRERADSGTVAVSSERERPAGTSPSRAIAAGIAMVDVDATLADDLTAVENIMLGTQALWRPRLARHLARRKIDDLMKRLDMRLDLDVRIAELPADGRFGVKMLRALYRDARVLLLDEPTGALTAQDADALFRTLKRLAGEGLCVVVATRKIDEAMALGGRIAILREGRKVGEAAATQDRNEVEALMWIAAPPKSRPSFHATGDLILELRSIDVVADEPRASLRRVSLEIRAGEIVGVAGLAGNGQDTLAELIAGLIRPTGGEMRLFGRRLARFDAAAFVRAGVGGVPRDRRRHGIVAAMSIAENLVLEDFGRTWFNRYGMLLSRTIDRHAREIIADHVLDCPAPDLPASCLTDRQVDRLVLARALDRKPRLFVANQPTRGLDSARAAEVHRQIEIEREAGAAVLWISEDIDELLAHADAIGVLHEGRLSVPQPTGAFDATTLGHMMGGHGSLAQEWQGWGDGA